MPPARRDQPDSSLPNVDQSLHRQTPLERSLVRLDAIASKLESYSTLPSNGELVGAAARAGALLYEARESRAFDAVFWDDIDACYRQYSPQSGAPLNEGRRLFHCVAIRLAKSGNELVTGLGFESEPPHPQSSYDWEWLRRTLTALAALVRREAGRLLEADCRPPFEVPESTWLTVTDAARQLMTDIPGLSLDHARARVSEAAGKKLFRTNGRIRHSRRIEPITFARWRLDQRERDVARENEGH
ncbi:MAG: hypothetical protein ACKVS9_12485 [Phycisphaerae bacterium]